MNIYVNVKFQEPKKELIYIYFANYLSVLVTNLLL